MSGFKGRLLNAKKLVTDVSESVTEKDEENVSPALVNTAIQRMQNGSVFGSTLKKIEVGLIDYSAHQPRLMTDTVIDEIDDLAESIRTKGLINPIVVREKNGRYELIGGERRLRATRDILKQEHISALVRIVKDEHDASMLALIDNIKRENLSDFETMFSIKAMCEEFGFDFNDYEFITVKFSIDKSRYFRLKSIFDLPEFILDDLEHYPQAMTGYNAQLLKTAINKVQNEGESQSVLIMKNLEKEWSCYLDDYRNTKKRSAKFIEDFSNSFDIKHGQSEEAPQPTQKPAEGTIEHKRSVTTDVKSKPIKRDLKSENGVKLGSIQVSKSGTGKNVLSLRVSLESTLDEEQISKVEDFIRSLN